MIKGRIASTLSTIPYNINGIGENIVKRGNCYPLSMGGRTKVMFKTDDKALTLYLFKKADYSNRPEKVNFDIGKYTLKKVDTRYIISTTSLERFRTPSVGAYLSNSPVLTIAKPKWIMWNLYENYELSTITDVYGVDRQVVEYFDSNGIYFKKYAIMAGQGSGSMAFELRNSKYKLTNKDGSKFVLTIGDWLPRSTFHIKVNYVDFSQSKNVGGARFVSDWYNTKDASRKKYPADKPFDKNSVSFVNIYETRPKFVIDGIPCLISTFGNGYASGTFNLNAFAENFKLTSENTLHRGFKGGLGLTKDKWEELVSDTEGNAISEATWQPFQSWLDWMDVNSRSSKVEDFKAANGIKYDAIDFIDYYLFAEFLSLHDNGYNNMLFVSYDSVKFTPLWYDMDNCFGTSGGVTANWASPTSPLQMYLGEFFFKGVKNAFKDEWTERYKTLRSSGRFSVEKITEIYGGLIKDFPTEWYEMDFYSWNTRPNVQPGNLSSLAQFEDYVSKRLPYLDAKYGYIEKTKV